MNGRRIFVLCLVFLTACFASGEDAGGSDPSPDAGCYFKDVGLNLPGCEQDAGTCEPLHYWEACHGQCGQGPDGCGGEYLCACPDAGH